MAITKLQRHLDLIAYLVGRHLPVPVEELMEKIPGYAENWTRGDTAGEAAARRAFERDKDELRQFGIPLRTVKYRIEGEEAEGYEIARRDFYLPYLKLVSGDQAAEHPATGRHRAAEFHISERDAPLALSALRRVADIPSFPLVNEARSAFRKLAFDLDPETFSTRTAPLFIDRPGADELSERVRTLSNALLARKRLEFRYQGIHRGEETKRKVSAYGLLFQNGHWYLIGHDSTRNDMRVFRIGRMDQIVVNSKAPNRPDYEIPADFNIKDYVGRQAWELGDRDEQPVIAQVLFRFPQAVWAERNGFGKLIETRPDGSTIRTFDVHQLNPFLRWVLSLEGDAKIIAPDNLREELKKLAANIADAHDGDVDDSE